MKRPHLKQRRYLPNLLASFIILSIVILAVWFVSYCFVSHSAKENAISVSLQLLAQSQQKLEERVVSLRQHTVSMMMGENIASFINVSQPMTDKDYNLLRQCQNDFSAHSTYLPSASNELIFFQNSGVILGSMVTTAHAELAYPHFFMYENLTYSQWRQKLLECGGTSCIWPCQKVRLRGQEGNYFTYLHTFYSATNARHSASTIVFVPQNVLLECFNALDAYGISGLALLDAQNRVLYSSIPFSDQELASLGNSGQRTVDGERLLVLRSEAGASGLTGLVTLPMEQVLSNAYALNHVFLTAFLMMVLVSLALSFGLSYANSLPLRRIQKKLTDYACQAEDSEAFPLESITASINHMLRLNSDLNSQIAAQQERLVSSLSEQLFQTGFSSEAELQSFLQTIDLPMRNGLYCVCILAPDDYRLELSSSADELLSVYHLAFKEQLKNLPEIKLLSPLDVSRLALLIGENSTNKLRDFIYSLAGRIQGMNIAGLPLHCSFGVSAPFANMSDTPMACIQAEHTLRNAGPEINQVLFYTDHPAVSRAPSYNAARETQLTRLLQSNDADKTVELMRTLFAENTRKAGASKALETQFFYDLRSTLLHTVDSMDGAEPQWKDEIIRKILYLHFGEDVQNSEALIALAREICQKNGETQQQSHHRFYEGIIEYIRLSYRQDSLSLTTVAEHFQLSPAYLSRLIKAQTHVTFSEYVEGLRMELAKQCLENTSMPVQEIVPYCGYTNTNTFFKAFKRTFGITPSEYRRSRFPSN